MVLGELANVTEDLTLNVDLKVTQSLHKILFEHISCLPKKRELDRLEMI